MKLSIFKKKLQKILVVGTFRSGTNLLKFVLEKHFDAEVVFSEWFWKHGVPPTSIQCPVPKDVPIIVMTKEPVSLNESLCDFWKKRRPELDCGRNIAEFVRRRFVVYDNTGGLLRPKYVFPTPTDYWNQYYFSWTNWEEARSRLSFMQLERLKADPSGEVEALASKLCLPRRTSGGIVLPSEAVRPSQDSGVSRLQAPEQDARERLNDVDVEFVRSRIYPDVAHSLGYKG